MARVEYIDITRGLAMLLVILGHCNMFIEAPLNKFILSFHMPLFFFISGIFAKSTSNKELFWGGVWDKIQTLLFPQVLVIVIGLVKPVIQYSFQKTPFDLKLLDPFAWNVWFLPVLFICSIIYMSISLIIDINKSYNKLLLLLTMIICIPLSIWANRFSFTGFIHCLQIVPTAMAFYLSGNILKPILMRIEQTKSIQMSILAVISISVCFITSLVNTPVMMYANDYGNYLLFLICSILGCFFTIYISLFIKGTKLLEYVGTKSIAFYVWQGAISSFSLSISYRFVGKLLQVTNTNAVSLLAFSISMMTLLVIVTLTSSMCPQIYGKKHFEH